MNIINLQDKTEEGKNLFKELIAESNGHIRLFVHVQDFGLEETLEGKPAKEPMDLLRRFLTHTPQKRIPIVLFIETGELSALMWTIKDWKTELTRDIFIVMTESEDPTPKMGWQEFIGMMERYGVTNILLAGQYLLVFQDEGVIRMRGKVSGCIPYAFELLSEYFTVQLSHFVNPDSRASFFKHRHEYKFKRTFKYIDVDVEGEKLTMKFLGNEGVDKDDFLSESMMYLFTRWFDQRMHIVFRLVREAVKNMFDHGTGKGMLTLIKTNEWYGFEVIDHNPELIEFERIRELDRHKDNGWVKKSPSNCNVGLSMIVNYGSHPGMQLCIDDTKGGINYSGVFDRTYDR